MVRGSLRGIIYNHAWCEDIAKDLVYDPSNMDKPINARLYYYTGNITNMPILSEIENPWSKPDRAFLFYCPGCKEHHSIDLSRWTFNENMEKPTFSPSLLIKSVRLPNPIPLDDNGEYKIGSDSRIEGTTDHVCHSFIIDGNIQYLSDCTHSLTGQTVPLPDLDF